MGWWGFAKREQLHGLGFGFDLGAVPLCTVIGSAHSAMVAIQRSLTRARNISVDAPVAVVIPCGLGKGAGRRQQAGAHPRCQMLTRAHLACLRPLPLPHLVHPLGRDWGGWWRGGNVAAVDLADTPAGRHARGKSLSLSGKSPLVNRGWGMEEEEQEKEGEAEGQRSREAPRSRCPRKPQQEEEQDYFRTISERHA